MAGRKRIEINWEEFDKLCVFQATLEELSEWFDCSEDTIERAVKRDKKMNFADYYKKKSAGGKMSLRRKQMQIALAGNVSMLIWLGKQYLGQADKSEQEIKNLTVKDVLEALNDEPDVN